MNCYALLKKILRNAPQQAYKPRFNAAYTNLNFKNNKTMKDLFKSNAKIEVLEANYEGIAKVLYAFEKLYNVCDDKKLLDKCLENFCIPNHKLKHLKTKTMTMTTEQIAKKYVHGTHDALTDGQEIIDMMTDIQNYAEEYHKLKLQVEEKQKLVGRIYECDRSIDHSIVEVVEVDMILKHCFYAKVKILKNISVSKEYNEEYKKGSIVPYTVIHDSSKELTQEQYEKRVKELEKPEFEKGDYLLNDMTMTTKSGKYHHIDLVIYDGEGYYDTQFAGYSLKRTLNGENKTEAIHGYDKGWQRDHFSKITEQEAVKILTGKDYVLLEDSQQEQIKEAKDKDNYNMCTSQLVQLDCRNESCTFHKNGSCTNNKPALTITGDKVTC